MKTKEGVASRLAVKLAGQYPDACLDHLVTALRTLGPLTRDYESSIIAQGFVQGMLTLDEKLHELPGGVIYSQNGGRIGDLVPAQ